jgi:hypothetical protein
MRIHNLDLMTRLKSRAFILRRTVFEFRHNRYVSLAKAFGNIFKMSADWETMSREQVHSSKASDTIFILGNGPSLGWLDSEQIQVINQNDSLGISLSFLFDKIIPNYHLMPLEREWEGNRGRTTMLNLFQDYRSSYKKTIILMPQKALYRLGHPRWMPEAFPISPRIHYLQPKTRARFSPSSGFNDAFFEKSLIYRGILTVALDFAVSQGYQTIVLIGVDPKKWTYFYQDDPRLKMHLDETYNLAHGVPQGAGPDRSYVSMQPRSGFEGTLTEYLGALRSYLERNRNIRLMTAFSSSDLAGILPSFFQE